MSNHYDYNSDKTKAEKRERKKEKRREDMDAGKKAKLLHALAMKRAGVPDTGGRITKDTGPYPDVSRGTRVVATKEDTMRIVPDLIPEEQEKARERALTELLTLVAKGPNQFGNKLNGDDFQARIDKALATYQVCEEEDA